MHLNLVMMKDFNVQIKRDYHRWVAAAPDDWKSDDFLTGRVPVAVTSRYGQNQPLGMLNTDETEEGDNWEHDRQFSHIRYISIALATHLR